MSLCCETYGFGAQVSGIVGNFVGKTQDMNNLYVRKETVTKFIDDGRLVNTSIGTILIDLKKLRDNLNALKVNGDISTNLFVLYYEAGDIGDLDAEKYFKEMNKSASIIDSSMESLMSDVESVSDELDKISEKLMGIIKKAKKIRDSGLFESEHLIKFSDRDKINELTAQAREERIERYRRIEEAED